jgi:hypothetical protein
MSKERLAALVVILFFLTVFLLTGSISGTTSRGLGPRFFPYAVSVLGMALGLYLLVRDLVAAGTTATPEGGASEEAEESEEEGRPRFNARHLVTPLAIVGLSVVYSLVWNILGFILTSVVFLVLAMLVLGEKRPLVLSLYSVGIVTVIYLIFRAWLEVPLPRLGLWFL